MTDTSFDNGYRDSGYHDSYARYQSLDGYPNQPEIVGYAMSDVETVEMNALEACANEEARRIEAQAELTGWGCEDYPTAWEMNVAPSHTANEPDGALGLLQAIAHALGFTLTPVQR